jgi:hypothetical protein
MGMISGALIFWSIQGSFAAPAPKYGSGVSALAQEHSYFRKAPAPDFWSLVSHYVPQMDGRTCSMASFSMLLNAMESRKTVRAADAKFVNQKGLLGLLEGNEAVKRFFLSTLPGKSVSLLEFSGVLRHAFQKLGIKGMRVEVVHAEGPESASKILKILKENERSDQDFVVANFLQSELTGDPEGKVGHVAPVAAFDPVGKRVLILDPDREYYEPYWVPFERFMKGLETRDSDSGRNRGILWIRPE